VSAVVVVFFVLTCFNCFQEEKMLVWRGFGWSQGERKRVSGGEFLFISA